MTRPHQSRVGRYRSTGSAQQCPRTRRVFLCASGCFVGLVWCLKIISEHAQIPLNFVGSDACSIEKLSEADFETYPTLQKEIHVHFECVHLVA